VIGDDDFAAFYDPDEFGAIVQLIEQGQAARDVAGMFGKPDASGGIYRGGIDPGAANVRGKPLQDHFQIANRELPANWKAAKVVSKGVEYSIVAAEPLGRIRTLLTLVPYGDREATPAERGTWRASM
jgi:hypothetical protein